MLHFYDVLIEDNEGLKREDVELWASVERVAG
jgi:hypothetical protein